MNGDYLVGMTLSNRYEILDIIGVGGMATVYKAKDRLLNRYVAVKVLRDSLKDDGEIVRRFNSESQAAASLSHHNVVSVYDVGCEQGVNYFVMEYVEGITLKEYITKKGRLDWHEACQFAVQVGLAIDHAHSKKIVHRDIKPHNILITHDMTLKVTDFGIASAVSSETMVMGSSALGSVHYISPEQARGGYTDERSDIYSLGVVLYEMLTGQLPFRGDNAVSVALMHLNDEPNDIREIMPSIPENIAHIVMKAISKEQHARYQTAMDMVKDLRSVLNASMIGEDAEDATRRISVKKDNDKMEQGGKCRGKRKQKTAQQKKEDKIAVILAVATVVVIAAIALGTFFLMRGGSREVQVPDLTNKTIEEATQMIENAGLKLDSTTEQAYDDNIEEGHIISQEPGANQYAKKNAKVKLVVSMGKSDGNIEVPSVTGIDYKKAITQLTDKELDYRVVQEANDNYNANEVIRQSPISGTKLKKGDVVTLYVSSGASQPSEEPTMKVPGVIGKTRSEAEKAIKEAGFLVGNVSREYNDAPENTVISQSPTSGSESPSRSYISIVLSRGPSNNTITNAPTQPPSNHTQAPTNAPEATVKTLTLQLPQDGRETVHVKVVANGKTIHDQNHATSERAINIPVKSTNDASVQAYIDGQCVVDKVIEF
jgi:serine/threonine-protein kinase